MPLVEGINNRKEGTIRGLFDNLWGENGVYVERNHPKDRVPYAVEAYPEGAMAHLSAESGLYSRIITEGLFGIQRTSFKPFKMKPILPSSSDKMELVNNKVFGKNLSLYVSREVENTWVKVLNRQKVVYDKIHPSKRTDFIKIEL